MTQLYELLCSGIQAAYDYEIRQCDERFQCLRTKRWLTQKIAMDETNSRIDRMSARRVLNATYRLTQVGI